MTKKMFVLVEHLPFSLIKTDLVLTWPGQTNVSTVLLPQGELLLQLWIVKLSCPMKFPLLRRFLYLLHGLHHIFSSCYTEKEVKFLIYAQWPIHFVSYFSTPWHNRWNSGCCCQHASTSCLWASSCRHLCENAYTYVFSCYCEMTICQCDRRIDVGCWTQLYRPELYSMLCKDTGFGFEIIWISSSHSCPAT